MSTLEYILKKYNLPTTGSPIEIANVGRLDLIRWIRELEMKVGEEIGTYVGEYAKLLLNNNPQLKLFCIDAWTKLSEYRELENQDYEYLYQEALNRLNPSVKKGKCVIIRKTSMDALKDIPDEFLDFVYIDANHENPYVTQDIESWSQKVKKGGLVAGHDYIRPKKMNYAIIDALQTYQKKYGIQLFILGRHEVKPNEIRDRVRSWCFTK